MSEQIRIEIQNSFDLQMDRQFPGDDGEEEIRDYNIAMKQLKILLEKEKALENLILIDKIASEQNWDDVMYVHEMGSEIDWRKQLLKKIVDDE